MRWSNSGVGLGSGGSGDLVKSNYVAERNVSACEKNSSGRQAGRRTLWARAAVVSSGACLMVASGAVATLLPTQTLSSRQETLARSLAPIPLRLVADAASYSVRRIRYSTADPSQTYGDLYLPNSVDTAIEDPLAEVMSYGGTPEIPVVVLIHGGGWRARIQSSVMAKPAIELAQQGVAVWNIEYRRLGAGGGFPTTLEDVAHAVDYLRMLKLQHPQLDVNNVVVAGHSAGGQLAAWTASREALPPNEVGAHPSIVPKAVVTMAGVVNLKTAGAHGHPSVLSFIGGSPTQYPSRYALADPTLHIDPAVNVTCLSGGKDSVMREIGCADYVRAVQQAGGQARSIFVPSATHTAFTSTGTVAWGAAKGAILRAARG